MVAINGIWVLENYKTISPNRSWKWYCDLPIRTYSGVFIGRLLEMLLISGGHSTCHFGCLVFISKFGYAKLESEVNWGKKINHLINSNYEMVSSNYDMGIHLWDAMSSYRRGEWWSNACKDTTGRARPGKFCYSPIRICDICSDHDHDAKVHVS